MTAEERSLEATVRDMLRLAVGRAKVGRPTMIEIPAAPDIEKLLDVHEECMLDPAEPCTMTHDEIVAAYNRLRDERNLIIMRYALDVPAARATDEVTPH